MAIDRYICESPAVTQAAGRALGSLLRPGDAIGLIGDLGAGKTCLVQGLAAGLGVPEEVRVVSPTFTIVNLVRGGRMPLHHVDLYRIESASELPNLGLDELFDGPGVVAVEWCDRFDVLPSDHLRVTLAGQGTDERALSAEAGGTRARELAAGLAELLGVAG